MRQRLTSLVMIGAAWLAAAAPAVTVETSPADLPEAASLSVPYPDLGAMQPASRRKVEFLQEKLEKLLAEEADAATLAESFGFLGQMLHAFERLDAAAASYESARQLAPDDARWPYYLGLIRRANGDFEAAVEDFRKARSLDPDTPASAIRLADALLELGRLDEAEIYYARLEGGEETRAAALRGLGRIADLRGDAARAVELFSGVLELQPAADSVHYALAQVHRVLGDTEKARHHLGLGGEREVGFPDPHVSALGAIATSAALGVAADLAAEEADFSEENFLGFVLSQLGPVRGSVFQLEGMLQQLEESGQATVLQTARLEYAIGGLLVQADRDDEAVQHFRRAVAGDPKLIDARVKLGNVLARLGRLEEALEVFDEALEVKPDDPALLSKRATALVNLEQLEHARSDLDRVVELDPSAPGGWRLLAGVQERQGDLEGALASLQRAADLSERPLDKLDRLTELGDLNHRWRRWEEAARAYLAALKIDQKHVPALARLAALMGQLQTYDRSAEVYAKWIVVEPQNPRPRVGEATALILAGLFEEARDRLEKGIAVLPDNLDLKDILARHLSACPDVSVRDGARALELARALYESVPSPESIETLAMAHAQAGEFSEAVMWQRRLLDTASEETPPGAVALWQANLELYEQGSPCCAVASDSQ